MKTESLLPLVLFGDCPHLESEFYLVPEQFKTSRYATLFLLCLAMAKWNEILIRPADEPSAQTKEA